MADSAVKPPPLLFQRPSTIAPKTIPPPLPVLTKQPSIPSISHQSSLSFSLSHSSSQHSRHSSASTSLATLEEEDGLGGRRMSKEQQAGVGVIEEEKEFAQADEEEQEAEAEEEEQRNGDEEKEAQFEGEEDEFEDEDDTGDNEYNTHEDEEEEDDDSGEQSEPDVLRIRGDSHNSVSGLSPRSNGLSLSASISQSPVSRAFAIFGREIRHVSPSSSFSSDTLPVPFPSSQKRVPRTVPPPLPPALSPTSPSVAAASPSGKAVPPMVQLAVPPRSPQGLDVPSPLSPLQSPLTPTTPSSPVGFASLSVADIVSPTGSVHVSPAFLAQLSPTAPPPLPALSDLPSHSRSSSGAPSGGSSTSVTPVQARSAANSLAAGHAAPKQFESTAGRVRSSAPPGLQFPTGKLNARAAPAADSSTTIAPSAAGTNLSASSPLLSHSNAGTPPSAASGFTPSFTAPSVFASPSNRTSTTSAPSSPRRMPSSTVSVPPLHSLAPSQETEPVAAVLRPATAGEASRPEGRRKAAAAAVVVESGSNGAAADSQPQQAGKHKCSKCVSFSVRGSYCLKHLYYAGLSALAAPSVSPSALPPLSHTLSAASQPATDKMLKIADELLKTEKTYYEALKIAHRSFQLRLEVAAQLASNPAELANIASNGGGGDKGSGGRRDPLGYLPVVSAQEIGTIFSKLNDIYTLSSNLYHDLNTLNTIRIHTHHPHRTSAFGSISDSTTTPAPSASSSSPHLTLLLPFLGSTLLHYSSYFRVYQSYLENYDDAIKALVALRRERDVLDVWLTWTEKCEGLSIDSLLIQPVQRLPRYLLLLQEIIKAEDQRRASQPDASSGLFTHYPQGYADILTAREKISRIADAINSSLHDKETAAVVAHLQSLFEHDSHFVPFATPTRVLVKQGLLRKINETRRNAVFGASSWYHFFLFNDLFLYAEERSKMGGTVRYKLKNTVPLLDLTVVEEASGGAGGKEGGAGEKSGSGGGSGGKAERCWALRNEVTGKLLTLSCKSEKERGEWCEAIRGMQRKLRELTESMHVTTFDGVTRQEKKEKANLNKAKLMMGIGG